MKTPLSILVFVAVALGVMWMFAPEPDPEMLKTRTDLPWQISINPDGSSQVFDLNLGSATLADAANKFGPVINMAVFRRDENSSDLEAYFGDVMFGPLKAKVVVRLAAEEADKKALMERSGEAESSPTGDWKFQLDPADHAAQYPRTVTAISYVPATRGLDREFFLQRFGKPDAKLRENEEAESWFYAQKGLSVVIDNKSREVLEYVAPRDFVMPADVTPFE